MSLVVCGGSCRGGRSLFLQTTGGGGAIALSASLLKEWPWGAFSARLVQQIAAAAVEDGCHDPFLAKLSKLDSSGVHPEHCHAYLLRHLPDTHAHDAAFDLQVWVIRPPRGMINRDIAPDAPAPSIMPCALHPPPPGLHGPTFRGGATRPSPTFGPRWGTTQGMDRIPCAADRTTRPDTSPYRCMAIGSLWPGLGIPGAIRWTHTHGQVYCAPALFRSTCSSPMLCSGC